MKICSLAVLLSPRSIFAFEIPYLLAPRSLLVDFGAQSIAVNASTFGGPDRLEMVHFSGNQARRQILERNFYWEVSEVLHQYLCGDNSGRSRELALLSPETQDKQIIRLPWEVVSASFLAGDPYRIVIRFAKGRIGIYDLRDSSLKELASEASAEDAVLVVRSEETARGPALLVLRDHGWVDRYFLDRLR